MDMAYYINTGVVEEYVLGILNEADKQQFEALLPLHPELQQELLAAQILLPLTGQDGDITPPVSFADLQYKYTGSAITPARNFQKKSGSHHTAPGLAISQKSHTYIDVDKGIVIALAICVLVVVVCLCVLSWVLMQ
jgi:hypothetical protein